MNANIFREYDIRGIFDVDFNIDDVYLIGRAFGSKLRLENKLFTVVGYDNRISSPIIFEYLSKGIISTGINIINIGMVTTPMYYYAWKHFNADSGIMITASHNPKEYNGFKISFNGNYNAVGNDIKEFYHFIQKNTFQDGFGKIINENIKDNYIDFLFKSIKFGSRKIKVVVDSGNGASALVIDDIMNKTNQDYLTLYADSNPNYPNHHPDPSVVDNMKDLQQYVLKSKADVGFAYDGDADRIGMVDETGNFVAVDKIMILIIRNIIDNLQDKRILYDVKCSMALEDEINELNGIPLLSRTGNSYLRKRIFEDNILFGGELSGHVFFNDKFPGYDDGIYASLRIMEILSNTNKSVSELLEGINEYYSTNEIKIEVTDKSKFIIVEQVKDYCKNNDYNFIDIDGCKVKWNDAFVLIRASNTGPHLTLRFEAKSPDRLNSLQDEFMSVISKIKKAI
jgi:phosphomannomutase/phosphoglucomutase